MLALFIQDTRFNEGSIFPGYICFCFLQTGVWVATQSLITSLAQSLSSLNQQDSSDSLLHAHTVKTALEDKLIKKKTGENGIIFFRRDSSTQQRTLQHCITGVVEFGNFQISDLLPTSWLLKLPQLIKSDLLLSTKGLDYIMHLVCREVPDTTYVHPMVGQ